MRVLKYYVENKALSYCKVLKCEAIKKTKRLISYLENYSPLGPKGLGINYLKFVFATVKMIDRVVSFALSIT